MDLEQLGDRIVPTVTGSLGTATLSAGANVNVSRLIGNQSEATIAVNPTNPRNLVIVSNIEDVTGDGVADPGLMESFSTNGGATWTTRIIANGNDNLPTACCDPQAAFDQFGNFFLTYLSAPDQAGVTRSVDVTLSTDGGQTLNPLTQFTDANGTDGVDQPSIATGAGSVWVSWNQEGTIRAAGARVTGLNGVGAFIAPEVAPGADGSFGGIAVGPNGQVLVTYQDNTGGQGPANVFVSLDPDGLGPSGFNPRVLATTTHVGGVDLIPAQSNNFGIDAEANLAWDRSGGPHNGRAYLVYTDAPAVGSSDTNIFVRTSDDNGNTWSAPVRVNDDTGTNSQFLPAIAVDQTTGAVGVSWYDARNDVLGGSGNTDGVANDEAQLYASVSVNGGANFLANVRVSAGTSRSAASEPPAQGVRPLGFGDYESADFYGGAFYPVWADNSNSTGDNPDAPHMDIYTSRVVVGGENITATGGIGDDTYFLRLDPSGTYVQIYENNPTLSGPPTFTALRAAVQSITVNGNFGDDRLTIDFSNGSPIPAGGVGFDGGASRLNGNALVLQGNSRFTSEAYIPTGPTSGNISLSSGLTSVFGQLPAVRYGNVQQITDTVGLVDFPLGIFGTIPPSFTLNGTAGADAISVTNGAPVNGVTTLQASANTFAPVTFANKANVYVYGLAGSDSVTLNFSAASTGLASMLIDGGTENDTVDVLQIAGHVPLTVNGGAGDDVVNIGNGDLDFVRSPVTVNGQDGNDTVNLLDNTAPFSDPYTISDTTVARPYFGAPTSAPPVPGLTYGTIENLALRAETGNNFITVTNLAPATPVTIDGGGGSDTLVGPNFINTWGLTSTGQDTLTALLNPATNTVGHVSFSAVENLTGGSSNDVFQFGPGAAIAGSIDGGGGTNSLDYSQYAAHYGDPGVSVTLADGTAWGTATGTATALPAGTTGGVRNIQNVLGSRGNDHITGNSANNVIVSNGGLDVLAGGAGDDSFYIYGAQFTGTTIDGGSGNDTLKGNDGANTWDLTGLNAGDVADAYGTSTYTGIENLVGGLSSDTFRFVTASAGLSGTLNGNRGTDWLDYSAYPGAVTVNLETGTATGVGVGAANPANHIVYLENVIGARSFANTLTGASTPLAPGATVNALGNALGSILIGGDAADVLTAGAGNSILIGGRGADTLIANAGTPGFDILIAGQTDFDNPTPTNLSVLNAFAGVWRDTTAANYGSQVGLLRDTGVTVGGTVYRLNGSSVHDDAGARDTLTGATSTQAALDWFFANLGSDFVQNLKSQEAETPIV
jgi:hypothetical protein